MSPRQRAYCNGVTFSWFNRIVVIPQSVYSLNQALELFEGLFDMTNQQPYQRPLELFCGYERNSDNESPKC
jgi:glycogen debranching enzyme